MNISPVVRAAALLAACTAVTAQTRQVGITTEAASPLGNPRVFIAHYDPRSRSGDVTAQRFAEADGHTPLWSASSMLEARSDASIAERLVLSVDERGLGIPLQWSALSPAMRAVLGQQGWNAARLAFLRGTRSETAVDGLRLRAPRLGSILNANLWFSGRGAPTDTPRRPMVFAGANDGMLHGFDAEDGNELLAYVPLGLLPNLAARMHPDAPHAYGVDGPVFSGDAPVGDNGAARTLLVGALGAGGRGFFLLDVSTHEQFVARSAPAVVLVDATAGVDPDIGQIFSPPVVGESDPNRSLQIVQMNNRRWAAVMGNGHFSTSGKPVLLIQYLDGARELYKVSPCATDTACAFAGGNGLSAPRLIDANGDGMVDLAYAGDLQGHVWKFDLSSRHAGGGAGTGWRVGFSGQPFFIARDAGGRRQPITAAPYWTPHPQGGVMLAVGTGRHLSRQDRASQDPQTIYGLYDDSAITSRAGTVQIVDGHPLSTTTTSARPASLVQQQYGPSASVDGTVYHYASSAPVSYTGADRHRGWWIDLPHAGQRVLHNPRSFEGQKILVQSVTPTVATAASPALPWDAGTSYLSVLNILTGHPPVQAAFAPADAGVATTGIGMASTPSGPALLLRKAGSTQLRYPASQRVELRNSKTIGARASWREHP